jgi:ABC-type transporter Mla subunit MlaD
VTDGDPDVEDSEPAGKVRGMASLEDLEARVTALEEQVRQSREDATAARVLAGAADRDVSEFKQLLNALIRTTGALRETQVEDHRDIATLKTEVGSLRADVTSGFTKVNIGMDRMAQLLQQVIDKD